MLYGVLLKSDIAGATDWSYYKYIHGKFEDRVMFKECVNNCFVYGCNGETARRKITMHPFSQNA